MGGRLCAVAAIRPPVLQFASKFLELTTTSCTLQQFPTLLAFVGLFPVSRFHWSFCYCCALRSVLPATARRAALCTALRRAPLRAASSPAGPPLRSQRWTHGALLLARGSSPPSRRRTSAARGRLPQGTAAAECGVAAPGFDAGPPPSRRRRVAAAGCGASPSSSNPFGAKRARMNV